MRKWRTSGWFRVMCFGVCACVPYNFIASLVAFVFVIDCFADTARLTGTIYTFDANQIQTVWPNARVTLKNVGTGREVATVSNELGQYSFAGVLPGDYELTVVLAGFEPVTKRIKLRSESPNTVDAQLALQKQAESVSVSANPAGIDTASSSSGSPVLTTNALKSLIRLNNDFQEALPLLPGVTRGTDGLIRIKGGNANQTNALINNVSIGDPFTGQPALRLPAAAVESIRVLSNPFSAEFGGFSSGVVPDPFPLVARRYKVLTEATQGRGSCDDLAALGGHGLAVGLDADCGEIVCAE